MDNISKHISYSEATTSATAIKNGIDNTPTAQHLSAMKNVAAKVFEPLRTYIGEPIRIASFYRTAKLNPLIPGASTTSQHMVGEAIDIERYASSKYKNADLFAFIYQNLNFDQLIWEAGNDKEPDWVHVSLKASGTQRKQALQMYRVNGSSKYKEFSLWQSIKDTVKANKAGFGSALLFGALAIGAWKFLKL